MSARSRDVMNGLGRFSVCSRASTRGVRPIRTPPAQATRSTTNSSSQMAGPQPWQAAGRTARRPTTRTGTGSSASPGCAPSMTAGSRTPTGMWTRTCGGNGPVPDLAQGVLAMIPRRSHHEPNGAPGASAQADSAASTPR